MSKKLWLLPSICVLGWVLGSTLGGPSAFANPAANGTPFQLELLASAHHVDARERLASGALFNRDEGRKDGWQLGLRASLPAVWVGDAHWAMEARRARSDGLVRYIGLTQTGFPVITQTRLQLSRSELRVFRAWRLTGQLSAELGAGVGEFEMDRNILPALNLPLQEVLRERTVGAHLGVIWSHQGLPQAMPKHLALRASQHSHRRSSLWVNSFGVQDDITLAPARSKANALALELAWPLSQHSSLVWQRRLERLAPGASEERVWTRAGVANSLVRYPGAQIDLHHKALGLRMHW